MILVRDEAHYSRTLVFDVSDQPRQPHPESFEIQPECAKVTVYRKGEREPWTISHVTVSGPRILRDGTVGSRRTCHAYQFTPDGPDPCAPKWLVALVADTHEQMERDRTGVTA